MGVQGVWGMGHMGNGAYGQCQHRGQWGTGGMRHIGNSDTGGNGVQGYGAYEQ